MTLLPDEILALTIWGEARGESIEGQVAVANVIFNRFKNNLDKYKTIADVCLEPKQFSCWNDGDGNRIKIEKLANRIRSGVVPSEIKQQLYIARGVMGQHLNDNTKDSKHYITRNLWEGARPKWAKYPTSDPIFIGSHVFFNV